MIDSALKHLFANQWLVFLAVSLLLLVLAEAGYRFGIAARHKNSEVAEGHGGSVQGAVLGLLGLLLGFSFAMAVGRYDDRRKLVVEESNSIGTTWLRADFMGETKVDQIRELLRRYVEIRLEACEPAVKEEEFSRLLSDSETIQKELWAVASKVAVEKPDEATVSFINSLNETIDLQSSRLAAMRNHVPGAVWLLLISVAGCGAWASGYGSGTGGHRSAFNQMVFPVLIGVVITLISDMDQPRQGLINISQESMRGLLESTKQ